MRTDQLARLETLRDRLLEVSLVDANPDHWIGKGKRPDELTREERGDAKWCRSLAVQTVALTMQVQRLMLNPATGNAVVPEDTTQPPHDETETVESEIARYETAAAEVLNRAARGGGHAKR